VLGSSKQSLPLDLPRQNHAMHFVNFAKFEGRILGCFRGTNLKLIFPAVYKENSCHVFHHQF